MILAASIKHFLEMHKIHYRVFYHERNASRFEIIERENIPLEEVIYSVVLQDSLGNWALAVCPLEYDFDLEMLNTETHRNFKICHSDLIKDALFIDCEPGVYPPFGEPYGLECFLDPHLKSLKTVYFEGGYHTVWIQLSGEDFQFLTSDMPSIHLSRLRTLPRLQANATETSLDLIQHKLTLPHFPETAEKILKIARDPSRPIQALIDLISQDTLIKAQILCYAESTQSLDQAVTHVLGFDTVSHIALGLAAGRAFQLEGEAPLGLQQFWKHALYCAALAKKISEIVTYPMILDKNLSYLSGLLHNFGFLLFGYLFAPEFRLLNKWILLNPDTHIQTLEARLLGMGQAIKVLGGGHAYLGGWLMEFWKMPEIIIMVAKEHHNTAYQGVYAPYVYLIQLCNQLLRQHKIGDGEMELDNRLLKYFNIIYSELEEILEDLLKNSQSLEDVAIILTN